MNSTSKYYLFMIPFLLNACSNSNALKQNNSKAIDSINSTQHSTDTVSSINDTVLNTRVNHDNPKRIISTQIEKFDYSTLKKLRADKKSSYLLEDSTMIELGEEKSFFYKKVRQNKSNYVLFKTYYKSTRGLKNEIQEFSKLRIGIQKNYNLNGTLIDSIDYDVPFKFTLQDLIIKLQEEYNIDITHTIQFLKIYVARNDVTIPPRYSINIIPLDSNIYFQNHRYIVIDGTTGKTIIDDTYFPKK